MEFFQHKSGIDENKALLNRKNKLDSNATMLATCTCYFIIVSVEAGLIKGNHSVRISCN